MIFTFLVVATGPSKGTICHVQQGNGEWGRREGPPTFEKVTLDATRREVRYILKECKYDFDSAKFVNAEDGLEFSVEDIIEDKQFADSVQRNQQLCELIVENPSSNYCEELIPPFVEEKDMRRYWYDRLIKYRRIPSVKAFLQVVRSGSYADARDVVRTMSRDERQDFFSKLDQKEIRYLKSVCLANTPTERLEYLNGNR